MAKRKLCNFANASEEVPVKGAMYQRGQFYIVEDNKRKGDRRRYRVMINDSFLGFGGSLVRVKRFVNDMYKAFPFAEDVGEDMADKVKRFGRRAQMELRPSFKPNKQKSKSAGKKTGRPSASKKSSGKRTAAQPKKIRAGTEPVLNDSGQVVSQGALNKKQADDLIKRIKAQTNRTDLITLLSNLDVMYTNNANFRRMFKVGQAKLKEPIQGRLF